MAHTHARTLTHTHTHIHTHTHTHTHTRTLTHIPILFEDREPTGLDVTLTAAMMQTKPTDTRQKLSDGR